MRKTDDSIIIEMLAQGKLQKEIAEHFNVSPAAICKRIKRLQPIEEPESFKNLSQKEKKFALEIAEGKTQTQAAMNSFDVTTRDSAKAMGTQLMAKPDIKMAVSELMQEEGLTKRYRVRKLKTHVDAKDPGISLKALDQSWKLDGAYSVEHLHLHMTREDYDAAGKSIEEIEREIEIEKAKLAGGNIIEAEVIEEDTEETEGEEDTKDSEEQDSKVIQSRETKKESKGVFESLQSET